jgi:hypothetical protein
LDGGDCSEAWRTTALPLRQAAPLADWTTHRGPWNTHRTMRGIDAVPALVRRLYRIVHDLEAAFPGRKFTLDGHLVGSIGEVLAAHRYGLALLPASAEGHDARARDGRLIQIKATQGTMVGLRTKPQHLLVLRLNRDGTAEEIYNGPGAAVWRAAGKMQKNGQRPIGVAKLRVLMAEGAEAERLPLR